MYTNKKLLTGISMVALAIPMFAFAQSATGTGTTTATTTHTKRTVDPMCISAAIEKRDSALISSVSAFSSSVTASLTARKDALKAAVVMTDRKAKEAARKKAWSDFRTSSKASHSALVSARKSAWSAYNTDARACGQPNITEGAAAVGGSGISL